MPNVNDTDIQQVLAKVAADLTGGRIGPACTQVHSTGEQWRKNGRIQEAANLFQAFAYQLLGRHQFGPAADFIKDAAEWCQEDGRFKTKAADLYSEFADKLFQAEQYGWAGSRYYYAAMVYVTEGDLGNALQILKRAGQKPFRPGRDEPFARWLPRHIEILESNRPPITKLKELRTDFERESRDSWVRSCYEGIKKLTR